MWLMDCIWRKCLFLANEVDPPLTKPPEMVLIVPRMGVGGGDIGASWLGVAVSRLLEGGLLRRVCSHCRILYGEFASPPCGRSQRRGVSTYAWRQVGGNRRCWRRGQV